METRRQRRLHTAADEQVHNVLIKQHVQWVAEDSHASDLVNQQVELDMESTRFIYTDEDPYYTDAEAHVVQEFTPVPQTDEFLKAELDLDEEYRDEINDPEDNCKELVLPLAFDQQLRVNKSHKEVRKENLDIHMHTKHLQISQSITPIECKICSRIFKKKNDLKRHLSTHGDHGKQEFLCDLCERTFPNKISLRRHHKVHAKKGRNKFKASKITCEVSRSSYTEKKKLRNHMIRKHVGKAQSNSSGTQKAADDTENTHTEEFLDDPKHKCEYCSRLFKRKYNLDVHLSTHATESQESASQNLKSDIKSKECKVCHRIYPTENMRLHMSLAHSKPKHSSNPPKYQCEFCLRLFKIKRGLERHLSTHSTNRKRDFACDICERTFFENSKLVRHMKLYAQKDHPKFNCKVCSSRFTRKGDLDVHLQTKHLQKSQPIVPASQTVEDDDSIDTGTDEFSDEEAASNEQPSQESIGKDIEKKSDIKSEACEICHGFYPTEYIQIHMRLAHSKPKHKCEFCSRLFKIKRGLERHLRTHSTNRKRDFACDICERAFNDKAHLIEHKKRYAEKDHPKFNCEVCSSRFTRKGDLDVHLQTKHLQKSQPIVPASQTVEDDDSIDTGTDEFSDEEAASNEQPSQESIGKDIEKKSDIKSEACEICHGFYPTEYIQIHMRLAHSKPRHKCEFCSRLFKKKYRLTRHLRIHATNRKRDFVCDICERAFYDKAHLVEHKKRYAEKDHPKFNCKMCRYSFKYKGNLEKHMLTKHLDKTQSITPDPQTAADYCINTNQILRNKRTERATLKCGVCCQTFNTPSILKRHFSTHSKDRKRNFS